MHKKTWNIVEYCVVSLVWIENAME